jgi:hypothetical protein|tara:strand:+ start:51 stop:344 length:294 start_codon:yes stop_codon:yes gene_type:complete
MQSIKAQEEKELTYAQNQKLQNQFLRFLASKLHTINSMSDEINRDFIFNQMGCLNGSTFGWSESNNSYSMSSKSKDEELEKYNSFPDSNSFSVYDPI